MNSTRWKYWNVIKSRPERLIQKKKKKVGHHFLFFSFDRYSLTSFLLKLEYVSSRNTQISDNKASAVIYKMHFYFNKYWRLENTDFISGVSTIFF